MQIINVFFLSVFFLVSSMLVPVSGNEARYGTVNSYYDDMTDIAYYLEKKGICDSFENCKTYDCTQPIPIVFVEDVDEPDIMRYFILDFMDTEILKYSEDGDVSAPFFAGKLFLETVQATDQFIIKKGHIEYPLHSHLQEYFEGNILSFDVYFKYGFQGDFSDLLFGIYFEGVESWFDNSLEGDTLIRFTHSQNYDRVNGNGFLSPEIYIQRSCSYEDLLEENTDNWNTNMTYYFSYEDGKLMSMADYDFYFSETGGNLWDFTYMENDRRYIKYSDTAQGLTDYYSIKYKRDENRLISRLEGIFRNGNNVIDNQVVYQCTHDDEGNALYTKIHAY